MLGSTSPFWGTKGAGGWKPSPRLKHTRQATQRLAGDAIDPTKMSEVSVRVSCGKNVELVPEYCHLCFKLMWQVLTSAGTVY